jgi:macrolide transport system ATP-binding/permease protein
MSLIRRIANLFARQKVNREIDAELKSHLEMRTLDNLAAGMETGEARRDALVRFGSRTAARESMTGADMPLLLASVWSDVRYALRQLVKNPGFAATAILVLALGIGSSVAIFAFVDAALIKPLPYRDPARLVALFESMTLGARYHISYQDYIDWKRTNQVFNSVDLYNGNSMMLTTPSGAENADGATTSGGFFRTLGVKPALGRDFSEGEEQGAPRSVLLSYDAWQRRFGGRADAVGQAITIDGVARTIIGVLPREFHFAPAGTPEFWSTIDATSGCSKDRGCHSFSGVARLKDGVTVEGAAAEMRQIMDRLARQYPNDDAQRGGTALALSELITGDLRPILLVLLSGAGVLLMIACVNVASLLLVRSESRKREIAVRGAMGASPVRLVRQLVTEGLVLVAASTLLGLCAAQLAMHSFLRLIPARMMWNMPYLAGMGMNLRVAAFAAALATVACLLFSLTPALRLSRSGAGAQMRDALAAGGRGFAGTLWRRFGSHLVVVELAMALVLLVCAGLLGKSFYRLLHTEIGLDPQRLVAMRILAPHARYPDDASDIALNREIVSRLTALPGVESAGTCVELPVGYNGGSTTFRVEGRPYHGEHVEVLDRSVDANCFLTLGARILRGRNFIASDDAKHPPVTIINQAMAKKHFPGEDPLGKKVFYSGETSPREIVGIVNDIKEGQLDDATGPAMYLPYAQVTDGYFFVVVRTSYSGLAALEAMRAAVKEIDPTIATAEPTIMSERIHDSPSAYLHRSSAWLVGGFAGMALLLGVVGLYGVIAYSVSRRTREIGVRMALGAERGAVYALVVKEAAWLTAIGTAVGLVCSLGAAMLMRKLLFGTAPWDVATMASVAAILAVCAMAASFIPAWRAASVNPVEALRTE